MPANPRTVSSSGWISLSTGQRSGQPDAPESALHGLCRDDLREVHWTLVEGELCDFEQ
jgi:hypothetical protein